MIKRTKITAAAIALLVLSTNLSLSQLSVSETDGLRIRLSECWNPPPGVDATTKLHVVFRVQFKRDGSLAHEPILVEQPASPLGAALAASARKALLHCEPFTMLKPEHYDQWKEFLIGFDPQELLADASPSRGAPVKNRDRNASVEAETARIASLEWFKNNIYTIILLAPLIFIIAIPILWRRRMNDGKPPDNTAQAKEPSQLKIEKQEPDVADWYYATDGVRHGPVSRREMQVFVNKNKFDENTRVWRKGMQEWVSVRDSELGVLVSSEPPPLPPNLVSGFLVWILALLPILFFSIDASVARNNLIQGGLAGIIGAPYQPNAEISIFIPATINAALCMWDSFLLKRAGYNSKLIGAALIGFFLVPGYLYWRARHLHQRQSCVIVWLATTALGAMIYGSAI